MTPSSRRFPLVIKIVIGIALVFLVILSGAWVTGMFFLKPILGDKLEKQVFEKSSRLYQLQFASISYNPFLGNLSVSDVQLKMDTTQRHQLKQAGNETSFGITTTVPKLRISGVGLLNFLLTDKLRVGEISFNEPDITIFNFGKSTKEEGQSAETLYDKINDQFKEIAVDRISCEGGSVKQLNIVGKQILANRIHSFSWTIDDVLIDSTSHRDTSRIYYAKHVKLALDSLVVPDKINLTQFRIGHLDFSTEEQSLRITDIGTFPNDDRMTFVKKSGGKSYTKAEVKNLEANGFSLAGLSESKKLRIRSLKLSDGKVNAFEVRNRAAKGGGPIKLFPHQQFRDIAIPVTIDSVSLKNIGVYYEELNPETQKTGVINFQKIAGVITNLTNDSLQKSRIAKAHFQGIFMGKAELNTHFTFDLASSVGKYTCEGRLEKIDLTILNPAFAPLALMNVESGIVESFQFNFSGNNKVSNGNCVLLYHDLKVELLKKKEKKKKMTIRELLSFTANKLLIHSSNPITDKEVRKAKISYERIPGESFFGILWRSLFSGLSETVVKL